MDKQSDVGESNITNRIHNIRGQRVILDAELAAVYGVTTKRSNEQVKRNADRFPIDFMFQLTDQEVIHLRSHFVTSSEAHGGRRYNPFAFTEHGAVMAANVLNSPVAITASILVVRAFIRLRELIAEHEDLRRRLNEIELRLSKRFAEHEEELRELRFLISNLQQPEPSTKRRIGF
jgi:hypothetical protein